MTVNPAQRQPDPLLAELVAAQARHRLFPQPSSTPAAIVVAVSGGADSVCLLHALHALTAAWGLHLHVAHMDHGLRPTSSSDASFVADMAAVLGLPYHMSVLEPQALCTDPAGLEAAARQARYQFLRTIALNVTPAGQVPCVAVAHHADDQAETVLMRLVQGGGLRGLGGMLYVADLPTPSSTDGPKVRLVRPLLAIERTTILAYLERHHLQWCWDESNLDTRFLRNRLRHQIMPLLKAINPNLVATFVHTASLLAAEAERTAAFDRAQRDALTTEPISADRVVLDLIRWRATHLATRRGVLRAALESLGVDERAVGFAHVEAIIAHTDTGFGSSGPHPLADGCAWTIVGATRQQPARLCLHRMLVTPTTVTHPMLDNTTTIAVPPGGNVVVGDWALHSTLLTIDELPSDWRHNPDPWRMFADADTIGIPILATPQPGQLFEPLGMAGHHKHVADLFTDAKTPRSERSGWPLLVDRASSRVLWVCGYQPSEQVRITGLTRRVVCFWWAAGAHQ